MTKRAVLPAIYATFKVSPNPYRLAKMKLYIFNLFLLEVMCPGG